jgi:hypothetical protein
MPDFLQPDPVILFFLTYKQVLYLPLIALLALVRLLAARASARALAGLALLLALTGLAARLLPELLNTYEGPLYAAAGAWRGLWGGAFMGLAASVPLLLSGLVAGRRWWGIDLLHGPLLLSLLGLWGYATWL